MYSNKLSRYKIKKILECFCIDIPANKTAVLLKINRNTINRYYNLFRQLITQEMQAFSALPGKTSGEFECDESYFGARRVRGKRGRGAAGKTPVFGLLKRGGHIHVAVVQNCSKAELMPIIQGHVLEGSTIHTDGWKAYDGLILNGYDHYRVFHSHDEFARGKSHVNGVEAFWSYAKRRLAKFNGLTDHKFFLHLNECAFRYNHKNCEFYQTMLKLTRKNFLC